MNQIAPQYTRWTDRLALEVALSLEGSGDPLPTIALAHNLTPIEFATIQADPVFDRRVETLREDLRHNGLSFKLKARAQAEELLTTSWNLIHDYDVSPAVKADLIKSTVKWAGLEPQGKGEVTGGGGGVSITINLEKPDSGVKQPILINAVPEPESGES